MKLRMRDLLEQCFGARITAFAEPTDDGLLFEGITVDGVLVRADSLATFLVVLGTRERPRPPTPILRLVA